MAESRCPAVFEALGAEVFRSSLFALLDPWILSLFVGCVPARFLDEFWDLLLLPSTQLGTGPQEMKALCGRGPPSGLSKIIAFALAALGEVLGSNLGMCWGLALGNVAPRARELHDRVRADRDGRLQESVCGEAKTYLSPVLWRMGACGRSSDPAGDALDERRSGLSWRRQDSPWDPLGPAATPPTWHP